MYLKAIEIQGFKSFPDKTVMTFGSDITAIVGPNGSGKSNISDAIRWVMGEMSTKALRGSKMEDVIFGGTLKRPQVGFAEVSLILDNTARLFNVESAEVMVTRRYYRSGDSEYYINRQTARLRDINELFMDTGLGKEGYCNIGQGRIDEILSAKSTDRREIFEEAAGISKFRHRKEETERKLQQTQDNLLRINDKISELELQVVPLKEQAEKAKKYLVFHDELRGLEVTVWLAQLDKLTETAKKTAEDYNSAKFILEQGKTDLDALYEKAEQLAESIRGMDVEAEHIRESAAELERQMADLRSDAAVLQSRKEGNEANIRRITTEITAQQSRSGDLEKQIAARERRLTEIGAERTAQQSVISEQEGRLQIENAALETLTAQQAAANAAKNTASETAAELRSSISANEQNAANIQAHRTQIETNFREAEARQTTAKSEAEACAAALGEAEEQITSLKNTISGYQLRSQSRIRRRDQLQQEQSRLKIRMDTLDSRIRMYQEMEKGYEGYSKATKIVMQETARGNLRNVHGPVSQLLRTEDDYTVAIETALGASMNSIVVNTEQDGKAAIQLLRRRDGGRATFLPISVIRGNLLRENGLEHESGFVGVASELITFDSKYQGIMENLLGRTVIAENMDTAIAIAGRHGHRFRIVTLDGQVLNAGGSMTGGSTTKSAGILTRANELQRMQEERETLTGKANELNTSLQAAAKSAAEAEAEIAETQNALRGAEDEVLKQRQRKEHYRILLDTIEDTISSAQQELQNVDRLLAGGQDQNTALQERLDAADAEIRKQDDMLTEIGLKIAAQNDVIAGVQTQLGAANLRVTSLNVEEQSTIERRDELKRLVESLSGDAADREKLIEEYRNENADIDAQISAKNGEITAMQTRIDGKAAELKGVSDRRLAEDAKKTRTEREAQQKNKDLMDMERECARLEQKKTTSEMEEKQLLSRLWDSYELTYSTAQEARVEIESMTAAQRRIAELKRKMNALGHPNLGAIEEFQRVNERYEYLSGQRDDVENSRKELQKLVNDITGEMTGIFTTEFQKINEYFGQTFTEMFGGGRASLQLEDENDVLSCGIEIKVQPPGKQVKTIMLLSGGEKAFVAIALYFAIMKVRPTPFCMLDEIDAALDDRNVARFAAYLRNLSSKTQFIVITHRRGTMEAADVLYGVTMQEQGVSKVLSVDLNQVVKELNIN